MNQLPRNKQNGSMSNQTKITIVLAFMGIGIFLLIVLIVFAVRGGFPGLKFSLPVPATSTQPFPTLSIPTPDCGSPTLLIGSTTLSIQNISMAADGTVAVPADGIGIAYWVEGTDPLYRFYLSPTPENVALISSLPEGSTAKATWKNCNTETFTLSAPQPGTMSTLPDPSGTGMVIFVPTDAAGNGLVASGGVTEEQISTFNTPDLSQGVQAEIGLLETTASPDGTSLQVKVSIYNYGTAPITLTANDVSLTPPGSAPLAMVSSEPPLPKEIAPAATQEFTLTFPKPTTPTATLKVFTVEYDVEGY